MWWGVVRSRGLGKKEIEVSGGKWKLSVGGMGDAEEGRVRPRRGAGINWVLLFVTNTTH